jgi:hypothetical protein
MNTQKLARTTFVLDRETHLQLNRISSRFGVSRSELVRDVLAEPVAMLAGWVDQIPETDTPVDTSQFKAVAMAEFEAFVAAQMDEVRRG